MNKSIIIISLKKMSDKNMGVQYESNYREPVVISVIE